MSETDFVSCVCSVSLSHPHTNTACCLSTQPTLDVHMLSYNVSMASRSENRVHTELFLALLCASGSEHVSPYLGWSTRVCAIAIVGRVTSSLSASISNVHSQLTPCTNMHAHPCGHILILSLSQPSARLVTKSNEVNDTVWGWSQCVRRGWCECIECDPYYVISG